MLVPSSARGTARYWLARSLQARPPVVWTAALLYLCGGLACLAAVLFPISSREPVRLDLAIGVIACAVAVVLWMLGRRLSSGVFAATMALGSLAVSAIVANAHTSGGAMLAAYAYPWIAVYTAHFCSRRVAIAQCLLISAGFGTGLIASGLSNMAIDWVIVAGTVWSTALVLGRLGDSLRQRAATDPLTCLLNRNGFLTAATRQRAIADRTRTPLTLAVLDLDGFKQVNDSFGHAAGDRLLADAASAWRTRLRAGDILARYGGDEFVLLLPATSPAEAGEVLERLRRGELPVSWSIGLGEWRAGETLETALSRADRDLYNVKRALVGSGGGGGAAYRARSLLPST
jgi:diguanylate cyclase (GGDEF)-like protein